MKVKPKCGHKVLSFGCQGCIDKAQRARFENWRKAFQFPKCTCCCEKTDAFMGYTMRGEKMFTIIGCSSCDPDGPNACSDLDYEFEIE